MKKNHKKGIWTDSHMITAWVNCHSDLWLVYILARVARQVKFDHNSAVVVLLDALLSRNDVKYIFRHNNILGVV